MSKVLTPGRRVEGILGCRYYSTEEIGQLALWVVRVEMLQARQISRPARADLERRAGCPAAAREYYEQAIALARSPAERVSFERRIQSLEIS
jgi:predicted RNA polymerase sigma factor